MAGTQRPVRRDGVLAGLIGAAIVAAWFAVLDLGRGALFDTPVRLGTVIGSLFLEGQAPDRRSALWGYTVFHLTAFLAVGILVSWIFTKAERTPSAFIGFTGLFVMFEVGWFGVTRMLAEGTWPLPWLQVFVANLLAAASMGWYLWRRHPSLGRKVSRELSGQSHS